MPEVTLIPGDGVGPELAAATRFVLDHAGTSIVWDEVIAGKEPKRNAIRSGWLNSTGWLGRKMSW